MQTRLRNGPRMSRPSLSLGQTQATPRRRTLWTYAEIESLDGTCIAEATLAKLREMIPPGTEILTVHGVPADPYNNCSVILGLIGFGLLTKDDRLVITLDGVRLH